MAAADWQGDAPVPCGIGGQHGQCGGSSVIAGSNQSEFISTLNTQTDRQCSCLASCQLIDEFVWSRRRRRRRPGGEITATAVLEEDATRLLLRDEATYL